MEKFILLKKHHLQALLMFIGFGYIAFGLGYSSLNRYDPSSLEFLSDTTFYFAIVENGLNGVTQDAYGRSARILHPLIANILYQYIPSFGSWNMVAFAMLTLNSIFVSLIGLIISSFALSLGYSRLVGLTASLIFLCNFATVNFFLAGLIDSSFCLIFQIFLIAIFYKKHRLLIPLFIVGTLFKELMIPYGAVFSCAYFLADAYQTKRVNWQFGINSLFGVFASFALVVLLQSFASGSLVLPWGHAANLYEPRIAPIFFRSYRNHGEGRLRFFSYNSFEYFRA